ncbi:MAG TPA: hypothetical protein VMT87_12795 [Vicinamibacteria bacterium]|nr:hypothetical protein [Vicinamibacteria bacterium]
MTTCLFCHQPFPENQTVERFVSGRRVAYDPVRGRLWAVCASCGRWTLAPFETRWEVLEDLERLTRGRARLLGETDQIALLEADDLEIVRVGRAGLREESWWRYGREFSARRRSAKREVRKGKVRQALFTMLITGIPVWGLTDADHWIGRARTKRFGKVAWRGEVTCDRCGTALREVLFDERNQTLLRLGPGGGVACWYGCARCAADMGWQDAEPGEHGHLLEGVAAEHVLRRLLAHTNFAGGTEAVVGEAMGLVESYSTTEDLIRQVCLRGHSLGALTETRSFALEIALNADVERRLLEMELEELESRWREEEEIAAIADGILTPAPWHRRLP